MKLHVPIEIAVPELPGVTPGLLELAEAIRAKRLELQAARDAVAVLEKDIQTARWSLLALAKGHYSEREIDVASGVRP